jgi:predicted Zn-ribbon and HTH transcriptional regulator
MSVDVNDLVNDVVEVLRPDETSADEPSSAEPIKCLECGTTIEAGESKCPKCGWTYVIA